PAEVRPRGAAVGAPQQGIGDVAVDEEEIQRSRPSRVEDEPRNPEMVPLGQGGRRPGGTVVGALPDLERLGGLETRRREEGGGLARIDRDRLDVVSLESHQAPGVAAIVRTIEPDRSPREHDTRTSAVDGEGTGIEEV